MRRGIGTVLGALLFGMLFSGLLAGCGGSRAAEVVGDDDGYHGTPVEPPFRVPTTRLVDDRGDPIVLARDDRALEVVFFGYTNCPDICQVVMGTIASAYARLSDEEQRRVRVAFVSTDPARDTAAKLRSYLDRFNPDFTGVRGPLPVVKRLAKPLGIYIEKGEELPSGGYAVDHGTHIVAMTGDKAPLLWSSTVSPTGLAADIERLLADATPAEEVS